MADAHRLLANPRVDIKLKSRRGILESACRSNVALRNHSLILVIDMLILFLALMNTEQPNVIQKTPFFSLTSAEDAANHIVYLRQAYLHLEGLIKTSGNTVNIKERLERFTQLPKSYIGLTPEWPMRVGSVNDDGVHFSGDYGTPGGWTTRIRMLRLNKSDLIVLPHEGEWTKKLKRGDVVKMSGRIADCTLEEIILEDIKIQKLPLSNTKRKP